MGVGVCASGRRINLVLMDFHSFCSREVSSHPRTIRAHYMYVYLCAVECTLCTAINKMKNNEFRFRSYRFNCMKDN